MPREETSEERLLKVIRKKTRTQNPGKEKKNSDQAKTAGSKKRGGPNLLELGSRILLLLSAGCAAYIVYNEFIIKEHKEIPTLATIRTEDVNAVSQSTALPAIKPFNYYEGRFKQRNIFELPGMENKPKTKMKIVGNIKTDLDNQLRLLGIVLDQDSKVIIEDIKTGQTFFMSEGEQIGEAVLEQIEHDRAIFNYNNKKVELVQ